MTNQNKPQDACDDMTCKNDLMSGLMSLFAQAEAEEEKNKADSSQLDIDSVQNVYQQMTRNYSTNDMVVCLGTKGVQPFFCGHEKTTCCWQIVCGIKAR